MDKQKTFSDSVLGFNERLGNISLDLFDKEYKENGKI